MTLAYRRQLHQSGVTMYNKCGEQFRRVYIEHERRPPSSFLICGTATDESVTYDLNSKILTGSLAHKDEVIEVALESIEKNPESKEIIPVDEEEVGKSNEQIIAMVKNKATRLVTAHHSLVAPEIKPFRVDRRFSVNLDRFLRERASAFHEDSEHSETSWERRILRRAGEALNAAARQGWDFVGAQDIVQGIPVNPDFEHLDISKPFAIRDTKTSKRSKNQDEVDSDDQLTAYAAASMVIDGKLPEMVGFDVLVDLKGGVKPQIIQSTRTEQDVDVYLNRVANFVSAVQQGVFVPTPQTSWWCAEKWCGFTATCPYFKKPKSVTVPSVFEGSMTNEKPKLVLIKPRVQDGTEAK